MIRVLLADDHKMMRAGLQRLIGEFDGFEIVGEASNGHETLQQIEKLHPNVVLMDVLMQGLNGLDATTRIRHSFPNVRVLILSMHSAEEYVLQAMRNGAHGYLVKSDSPTELELALRAVASGETYLSAAVSKHVISGYVNRVTSGDAKDSSLGRLTPRLRDVLQLVAEGFTTKQIAIKLELSPKTVETYRTQLMQALKINDVAGLVRYAVSKGLVTVEA
ncbi:MAG: response regulator transcription factor [Planctomycetia bacterium]|nr:response regulator transcription factor [Planctomycetia bacterium]